MTLLNNPFVTSGYIAPEYFCDRERETEELLRWLVNENNVAIISTRRMGKTGLIQHCFHLKEIKENYLQDGVQTELKHDQDTPRVRFSVRKSNFGDFKTERTKGLGVVC